MLVVWVGPLWNLRSLGANLVLVGTDEWDSASLAWIRAWPDLRIELA